MTISTAISLPSSIRAQAASDDSSMRHKPNIETKKMRQAPWCWTRWRYPFSPLGIPCNFIPTESMYVSHKKVQNNSQ